MTSHRWKRFFNEAGLPSDISDNYAIIFLENRIRFDMLDELNKEILYDMGIKKMGDVISILRHAKEVHSNSYREKVFNTDGGDEKQQHHHQQQQHRNSSPSSKTIHQADSSTLSSALNNKQQDSRTTRFVKLPQDNPKRIVKAPNTLPTQQTVRQVNLTPVQPSTTTTTIIRNVTGLNTMTPPIRKRIQPPDDKNDHNPIGTQSVKIIKTDRNLISNKSDRNKLNSQNLLTNFNSQIQKAISSNSPNVHHVNIIRKQIIGSGQTLVTPRSGGQQQQQQQQRLPVTARLSINKTQTTLIAQKIPNSSIKDRLGRKSVFERIESTSKTTPKTVFNRLGGK